MYYGLVWSVFYTPCVSCAPYARSERTRAPWSVVWSGLCFIHNLGLLRKNPRSLAEKFTRAVHMMHRSFLHHAFLYVDLRRAIRWEDGPQIVRHWKWWIPKFIGTGKKMYAAEAVNMILVADFPKHIAYLAIHNRTVNCDGKIGHGKPVDQLMEHYNL